MKPWRSRISITLTLLASLLFAGCGGGGGGSTPAPVATLQSIALTPASLTVPAALVRQFTATGTYSDGSSKDITASATWTSGTTSVATVTTGGLVTSLAAGSSVITATSGSISGKATLTVTAATLQSIAVTPANPSIAGGVTDLFKATGTYSDGTTQDISASVTWTSGSPAVATISASGLLTGVGSGTAVITATSGSISGTTTSSITPAGAASTLTIYPSQVVSGVIDQNGGAYSAVFPYLLVATGGNVGTGGYTWTAAPGYVLPFPSLSISINGVVTDASPKSLTLGSYTFYVEVSDGSSTKTAAVTLSLTSGCNSSNGNTTNPCYSAFVTNVHYPYLPNGKVGSPYAATLVTSGGTAPYTWTLESGTLPPGTSIDQAKGILKGTPTAAGTYNFYVLTKDSSGETTASELGVLAAQFTVVVN